MRSDIIHVLVTQIYPSKYGNIEKNKLKQSWNLLAFCWYISDMHLTYENYCAPSCRNNMFTVSWFTKNVTSFYIPTHTPRLIVFLWNYFMQERRMLIFRSDFIKHSREEGAAYFAFFIKAWELDCLSESQDRSRYDSTVHVPVVACLLYCCVLSYEHYCRLNTKHGISFWNRRLISSYWHSK